jgi:lysophospholipase L1-like esterase
MRTLCFLCALFLAGCAPAQRSVPHDNHVVFFGDSITELGDKPGGYVALLRDSLARASETGSFTVIGAGKSGNRVPDLLERVDRDVLSLHPTVVVIYIGINDVWHWKLLFHKGTPKDEYEKGLDELIRRITNAGARVLLCTPSVVGERRDGSNELDPMLDEYADLSRKVARSMSIPLCDLRSAFQSYLRNHNPQNLDRGILTTDEVHLNEAGTQLVEQEILKAFAEFGILNSLD